MQGMVDTRTAARRGRGRGGAGRGGSHHEHRRARLTRAVSNAPPVMHARTGALPYPAGVPKRAYLYLI